MMKRLTYARLPGDELYEVWECHAYGMKSPYLLRFLKCGVKINDEPFETEIGARKEFEKRCEAKSHNSGWSTSAAYNLTPPRYTKEPAQ